MQQYLQLLCPATDQTLDYKSFIIKNEKHKATRLHQFLPGVSSLYWNHLNNV